MSRYRNNPDAVRALVRPREVHRDVYIDEEVFDMRPTTNPFSNDLAFDRCNPRWPLSAKINLTAFWRLENFVTRRDLLHRFSA